MERIGSFLVSENIGTAQNVGRNNKMGPLTSTGSAIRRKRFSDITNIASSGRSERSDAEELQNPNFQPLTGAKDYIAKLLKENTALLRLLDEKKKIIELTGLEMQKLKLSLQIANQQNRQLAQANSDMLAELNLYKDRLKAAQHESGCMMALLKAKPLILEEEKLTEKNNQILGMISIEKPHGEPDEVAANPSHNARKRPLRSYSMGPTTVTRAEPNEVGADPSQPTNCKKSRNANRSCTVRSHSLEPTTVTHGETGKEKDEGRRKSLRRFNEMKPEELCDEPSEELFEIEDLKLPIRSQEDDSSDHPTSADMETVGNTSLSSQQHKSQEMRRSSLGRPTRRAAAKVNSYKEVPLNVKMRRDE